MLAAKWFNPTKGYGFIQPQVGGKDVFVRVSAVGRAALSTPTLDRIHHVLYVACREQGEREASPTAAMVDSQSVKSAEKGGAASIRMAMTRAKRSRGRSAIFS